MNQAAVVIGIAFLLIFTGLIAYFTARVATGRGPILRRIGAFETVQQIMGRVVEAGHTLHISLGLGSAADETTADSLAGLSVLRYLAKQAAATETPATISMADPTVLLFTQNIVRTTHRQGAATAYQHIRWIAPQPAAYAAGVMNILDGEKTSANVMVGRFGDEYLLMGETAARRSMAHVGGTSDPNTLPFIYASGAETLLGEEIYAAGAYLERRPTHIGSLAAQDAIRWAVALFILGSVIISSIIG